MTQRAGAPPRSWPRTDVVAAILVGLATAAIVWLRTPAAARGVIWAEDGRNFLTDAAGSASPRVWFEPYEGYLHLVPRVSADLIAHLVPIAHWATATTLTAALITGAVAACVVWLAADVIPALIPRIALGLLAGLVASGPYEVAGNLANLHTYFLWMTTWLLLYRPRTRAGAVVIGLLAAVASFTEIQVGMFIPLFLWRFRDARHWPARIGLLAGVVVQLAVTVLSPRTSPPDPILGPTDVLLGYLANGVGGLWWSHWTAVAGLAISAPLLLALACLPPAVAIAYGLWRGTAVQRLAMLALAGGSAVAWTVGYEANPLSRPSYGELPHSLWLSIAFLRYSVSAALFLGATMPLAIGVLVGRSRRGAGAGTAVDTAPRAQADRVRPHRIVLAIIPCAALIVTLCVAFVPAPTVRSTGPVWAAQAQSIEHRCQAPSVPGTRIVTGTIGPNANWLLAVSCRFVRAHD